SLQVATERAELAGAVTGEAGRAGLDQPEPGSGAADLVSSRGQPVGHLIDLHQPHLPRPFARGGRLLRPAPSVRFPAFSDLARPRARRAGPSVPSALAERRVLSEHLRV